MSCCLLLVRGPPRPNITEPPFPYTTRFRPLIAGLVSVRALGRGGGAVRPSSLSSLGVPLLAAAGAGVTILPFGYIAQRYLADLLPLLALSAQIGRANV